MEHKVKEKGFDSLFRPCVVCVCGEYFYDEHLFNEHLKSAAAGVSPPNLDGLKELRDLVDRQAEDEGLWFISKTASEEYLQQELRKLHHCIEQVAT